MAGFKVITEGDVPRHGNHGTVEGAATTVTVDGNGSLGSGEAPA
jgi:hypothetical protein